MPIVTPLPAVSGTDLNTASWTTGTAVPPTPLTKPPALADGDGLFFLGYDQVAASTIATPSTFAAQYHATATSTRGFYLFGKQIPSAAGEAATSYATTDSNSGRGLAAVFRVPGANMTTLLDAAPASDVYSGVSGSSMSVPGVTAGNAGSLHMICVFANGTGAVTHTFAATGYQVLFTVNVNNAGSTSSMAVLVKTLTASGPTGSVTVTMTPSDAVTNPASFGGFSVAEAGAPATATVAMAGAGTMGAAPGGNPTASVAMAGAGTMAATGRQTISSGVTMAGSGSMTGLTLLSQFLSTTPFYVVHRGGDADWAEDTAFAYANATAWNSAAWLECAVWPTSDGFWMLNDQATTGAAWNSNLTIASSTKATLQGLRSLADSTRPPMFFDEFGALYGPNNGNTRGIFLDNKSNTQNATLKALAESFGWGPGTLVAKSFGPSSSTWISSMSAAGYSTWGYFYDTDVPTNLATYQGNYTLLGLEKAATSGHWTTALSYGKKIIAHTIATAADKTSVLALGASGLMVSGVMEVIPYTGPPITMAGAGTMGAAGRLNVIPPSVAMAGAGTMAAAGTDTTSSTVAMAGSGSMAVAGRQNISPAVTMAGSGTMSVAGIQSAAATTAMSGVGTMAVTPGLTHPVAVTMAGFGVMSTSGQQSIPSVVTMAGVGVMGASPGGQQSAATTMAGLGTMTVAGLLSHTAAITMAGVGSMVVTGLLSQSAAAAMVGASTMSVTPTLQRPSAVSFAGVGLMGVATGSSVTASTTMAGAGVMTVSTATPTARDLNLVATIGTDRWAVTVATERWSTTSGGDRWAVTTTEVS